jgi:hypothetical protein
LHELAQKIGSQVIGQRQRVPRERAVFFGHGQIIKLRDAMELTSRLETGEIHGELHR